MAIKANVPIVPVACSGAHKVMRKRSLQIHPGEILVEFLEPIDASKYSFDERDTLNDRVHDAMAAGLPVVAYRGGGNPELINEQRGTLVGAGNEGEFADAVLQLLAQPALRKQLGRNARRFAEENFGLERVRNRYQELYESLLKKKGLRSSAE